MDVALLSRVTHEGYFSLLTCSRPALCIPGLVSRALSCWELSVCGLCCVGAWLGH